MGSDLNLGFHQMTYPAGFAQRYLSGLELWGETLAEPELAAWFDDEREGYANLGYNATSIDDGYEYDELSRYTGWRHLPERRWRHALGLGSATGVEFLPVAGSVDKITIVEPSQQLRAASVGAVALNYAEPQADGSLSFPDGTFDLVVCFGVLHHIAKVSKVIDELSRCTAPGGYLLIREPIISMGDWRRARVGITARERGIPLQ